MFTDFGFPPDSAHTRSMVDQRLKEHREIGGVSETLTIEWRGRPLHIEVIDMPLDALVYNPGTHRIRAQRSLDPARDRLLAEDPWSADSQDYLRHLLTVRPSEPDHRDPAFDELKLSLAEHKQNEPGLITRDGILVNGNTRCAALRELNTATHMRVGVLPESCTWADINDVELSLQLRPDRRRDYSYVNKLLAIDEQITQLNRDLPTIAKAFHTTVRSCERDLWILGQLRDVIRRSRSSSGASLRLMDLEGAKGRLEELHRVYMEEAKTNRDHAEIVKESRLAAIVLDFSKTDIRWIEKDFQQRYLAKELPEELEESEQTGPSEVAIPGLNRTIRGPGAEVSAARAVTDRVLRAKAVEASGAASTPEDAAEASAVISSYTAAFANALEGAGRDGQLRKKRLAAPDRIGTACKHLEQSITDVVMSRGNASLDEAAFDDSLERLRGVLQKLAIEAQRSIDLPGDGLTWLIAAVKSNGTES
ncbi:transcriptional regulator [Nocardia cyriacigeorgica]|uniref:Transcriptional regulator n=1 Tax=Nocardia cyriacigeorgica TaxID=135487 RepID=A0A6P1CTN1_9NOCA|nr:transcriptional regulator [Nocardia cyriacigeorgica]MBF6423973.1 transcriptional regulator [Nocardia cyriacigeorgica]NEW35227.1 transcriptional regulator [Nocardia cyriacigeorgica]